jgi:hypothetical protein
VKTHVFETMPFLLQCFAKHYAGVSLLVSVSDYGLWIRRSFHFFLIAYFMKFLNTLLFLAICVVHFWVELKCMHMVALLSDTFWTS